MTPYTKTYTRENCLVAFQIWEEQVRLLGEKFDSNHPQPYTLFDGHNGVVSVYADSDGWDHFANIIANKSNSEPNFVPDIMKWYGEHLDKLEKIWHNKKLTSNEDLVGLFTLASTAWVGLAVSYVLPDLKNVSKENQDLGMALRQRSADFLELTDHVIQSTLHDLYPDLGELVKYLTIEEIKNETPVPEKQSLKNSK